MKTSSIKKGLSDKDLAAMTWWEVRDTARIVARLRILTFPVMVTVLSLLWLLEAEPWRLWVFGVVATLVTGFVVHDLFWLRENEIRPRHVPYLIGVVLLLHTALITVTGGVESPFLVLFVVLGIIPAVTLGQWKPFLAMALVPVLLVWAFTLGALLGWIPDLTGDLWRGPVHFHKNPLYALFQAGIFTLSTFVGGSVLLAMRKAVDRTVRSTARARWDLIKDIGARNAELMALSGELAHELKNPLATIRGLSSLVAKRLEPQTREKEQMEVLVGEVKRMGEILDQFLNFSRPLTQLTLEKTNPVDLVSDVVTLHEGMAHSRQVRLSMERGKAAPIVCDPRKVRQILVNILQNALEASPRGGAVNISARSTQKGGARFVVTDEGAGIAEEVKSRLFTPGFTTKKDGTGLGLTIARSMAQQHDGRLTVEDRTPQGCQVTLTLPPIPDDQTDGPQKGSQTKNTPKDDNPVDDDLKNAVQKEAT